MVRPKWSHLAAASALVALLPLIGCSPPDEPAPPQVEVFGEGAVEAEVTGGITTLSASASEGWRFDHWEGPNDITEENPHNVPTSRVDSYVALFAPLLTPGITGSGDVEAEFITTLEETEEETKEKTEATLTATPDENWQFDRWEGDQTGTDPVITFEVEPDMEVTAVFVPQAEISISIVGEGGVSIDGVETSESDPVRVDRGTTHTIEAVAADGWRFDRWEGAETGTEASLTLTPEGDAALTAVFVEQVELTITIDGAGTVEIEDYDGPVPGLVPVEKGAEQTLTAEADEGWSFDRWSGDVSETDNPLTITVDEEMALTAEFAQQVELTVRILTESGEEFFSDDDPESDTFTGSGFYDPGTEVTIEAHVPEGWQFDRWITSSGSTAGIADPVSPSTTATAQRSITITSIVIDRSREHTLEIVSDDGIGGVPFVEGATTVTLAANIADCEFRLAFSERGYFLACWSNMPGRPEADQGSYGQLEVRNTFFHGEAVTLGPCSYSIEAGEASFTGEIVLGGWSGDETSSDETVTVIMDGDKTVSPMP